MNKTAGANTVCPFFVSDAPTKITCEGVEDHTLCTTQFRTNIDKKLHQDACCYSIFGYKRCAMAIVLFKKDGKTI